METSQMTFLDHPQCYILTTLFRTLYFVLLEYNIILSSRGRASIRPEGGIGSK